MSAGYSTSIRSPVAGRGTFGNGGPLGGTLGGCGNEGGCGELAKGRFGHRAHAGLPFV